MYRIIPASRIAPKRRRFPKLDWPAGRLEVGEAFIVPIENGRDPEGRTIGHLRVAAVHLGDRLGWRFSCSRVDGGLAISRVA